MSQGKKFDCGAYKDYDESGCYSFCRCTAGIGELKACEEAALNKSLAAGKSIWTDATLAAEDQFFKCVDSRPALKRLRTLVEDDEESVTHDPGLIVVNTDSSSTNTFIDRSLHCGHAFSVNCLNCRLDNPDLASVNVDSSEFEFTCTVENVPNEMSIHTLESVMNNRLKGLGMSIFIHSKEDASVTLENTQDEEVVTPPYTPSTPPATIPSSTPAIGESSSSSSV